MYFRTGYLSYLVIFISIILHSLMAPLIAMETEERVSTVSPARVPTLPSFISSESFEEIEEGVKKRYPQYFSGSDKLDIPTLESYRRSWKSFQSISKDVFSVHHNAGLLPLLEKLEEELSSYVETHENHTAIIKRFVREIQFYKERECVSPSWFDKLPFRFLCAISTFSPEERDFIGHLTNPYPMLFFALQKNDAWKNHESTVESMDRHSNKVFGLRTYERSILSDEVIQEIKERVEKSLPIQVVYSIWGTGSIGIALIVKTMIDDFFLVGASLKNLSAHGIPLSSYGFAVHDLFHKSVDHRQFKFIQHIIDMGEKFITNGGSIQKFLSVFLPSALCKYHGVMDGLKEIYQRIICTFEQPDSQKALLGFFWILHEEPHFPSVLYTVRNFDDILRIIAEDEGELNADKDTAIDSTPSPIFSKANGDDNKITPAESITAGVDLKDHFQTSPSDGTTPWTNDEIVDWVLKNKKVREARKYELMGYFGENGEAICRDDIVSYEITRSPRYIDVTFNLRQGEKLTYSFQTLFYNMQATHDALRILELIGIKTYMPDVSSTDNPRKIAQDFIRKGEKDIDDLITHFRKVASVFANEDIPKIGSLVKRYEQLYDKSNLFLFPELQE